MEVLAVSVVVCFSAVFTAHFLPDVYTSGSIALKKKNKKHERIVLVSCRGVKKMTSFTARRSAVA